MRPDYYPKMWFGTKDKMQWIDAPLAGAEAGKVSWGVEGTFLNGGGYARNAWDNHNEYVFSWRKTSSRQSAQIMQDYAAGVHGRGLIYFTDPLTMTTNILPPVWAAPSIAEGNVRNPLSRGARYQTVPTPDNSWNLPSRGLQIRDVESALAETPKLFIPIPPGMTLHWVYWADRTDASAGINIQRVLEGGQEGGLIPEGITYPSDTEPVINSATLVSGEVGVNFWVRRPTSGAINLYGVRAWLQPSHKAPKLPGNTWMGGQGNSGCRFVGKPTYIMHNGVDGGQIEYGAVLKEVGSWV